MDADQSRPAWAVGPKGSSGMRRETKTQRADSPGDHVKPEGAHQINKGFKGGGKSISSHQNRSDGTKAT